MSDDPLKEAIATLDHEHPLRQALEELTTRSEEDVLWRLGEVAMSTIQLARLEEELASERDGERITPFLMDAAGAHATLLVNGRRHTLREDDVAEVINALRDKEQLVRRGWYLETTDGKEMSQWLSDLERLRRLFEPG